MSFPLWGMRNSDGSYPLLLDSYHPTGSCSLQRLHLKGCVPNWLGYLAVLELLILCISLPDVKILGALPSLHFLKLRIVGGTNERIVIRGSDRFGIAFTNYILTYGNPLALRASNDLLYNTSIFLIFFFSNLLSSSYPCICCSVSIFMIFIKKRHLHDVCERSRWPTNLNHLRCASPTGSFPGCISRFYRGESVENDLKNRLGHFSLASL